MALSYDRYRPRYPAELFDDLGDVADLGGESRVLEVGSGPGVATEEMMARGWSVLAVDPGAQLAQIARNKFAGARFAVEVSTFDDRDSKGRRFDVVLSATAYHWVAPEVRWTKAAQVLETGGHLALATNEAADHGSFNDFTVATRALRERYGVDEGDENIVECWDSIIETAGGDIGGLWEAIGPQGTAVLAGVAFDTPDVRIYRWSKTYSTAEALGLLATYSRYLVVDPPRRGELFERLATTIDADFAGQLERHYVTILAMARRTGL